MTEHGRTFRIGLLTLIMAFVVVGGIVALSGSAAAFNEGGFNADSDGYNNSVTAGASDQAVGELVINPQSTGSGNIEFPDGITISDSSNPTVIASNYTDVTLTESDPSTLTVGYTQAGNGNYINISNIRVDVDASQVGDDPTLSGLAGGKFAVTTLNVTSNTTIDKVRGQNGVGKHNISLTNNTIDSGDYPVTAGEFNKSLIGADEEVEISIPEGEDRVSFDTSSTVKVYSDTGPSEVSAVTNGSEATVTDDSITFTTTGNLTTNNVTNTFETINITGIAYDTTGVTDDTVDAEFISNLTVTTRAEDPVSPREQEAINDPGKEIVNVDSANASLNRSVNVTSGINNDTRFNITLEDGTNSGGAIDSGDNEAALIRIPNSVSGFTFNTSDAAPPIELDGASGQNIDNTTDDNSDTDIATGPNEITLFLSNATNQGDLFNITNVTLNTAPGTTNQSFNLTVTTVAANGSDSVVQNTSIGTSINGTNTIEVANGNSVTGDVNGTTDGFTFGPTDSNEAVNSSGDLRPGDTIESAIKVSDKFGGTPNGITVDLNTTANPSDKEILNTDSVSTNESGEALFDVALGDQSGTYNVTASLAHNESANVTLSYEASPGEPADVSVTGDSNALVDDTGIGSSADNLEQGVFKVQLVDDNGNPANTSGGTTLDFDLETSGKLVNTTYNLTGRQSSAASSDIQVGSVSGSSGTVTYDPTKITDGDPAEFFVIVRQTSAGQADLTATVEDLEDSDSITVYENPDSVDITFDDQNPSAGGTVNVSATAATSSGETIDIGGINASFETTDRTVAYFRSDEQNNFTTTSGEVSSLSNVRTEGDVQYNVTFSDDVGDAFSDVTGTAALGAQPEPEPEPAPGQVELTNVNLDPDTVTNGTTNDHTLTFDATNVSDDGNTDTFTIEFPSVATLNSLDDASVTDADGNDVSITDSDVSGNTITVDVAPDSSADTRDLTVSADVNVTVADVTSDATADINIDVNNGQDSATATLTVDAVAPGDVPADIPDSVNAEQYTAFAGDDGEITQPDAINGFNGWFENGSYNGVDFEQQEALDLFNYWFNSG